MNEIRSPQEKYTENPTEKHSAKESIHTTTNTKTAKWICEHWVVFKLMLIYI